MAIFGLTLQPPGDGLVGGLGGAGVDLGLRDRAERMVDDDRLKVGHAECSPLNLGLMQELGGDDDGDRPPQGFESDAVMRTARRTRPSIADRGQNKVVLAGDGGD